MAVKVISDTPDPDVVKRITCGDCGVRLEFVPADELVGTSRDYTGSEDRYTYIECANCGRRIKT